MRCHCAASQRPSAVWHCRKLPATPAPYELIETPLFIGRLTSGQALNMTDRYGKRPSHLREMTAVSQWTRTEWCACAGCGGETETAKSDKWRSSSLCNYTESERRHWQYTDSNAFHHSATQCYASAVNRITAHIACDVPPLYAPTILSAGNYELITETVDTLHYCMPAEKGIFHSTA